MFYEEPVSLSDKEGQYLTSNYRELLRQSRKELSQWRKTHNEVFLQQACEKVFNALEQFVEIKRNVNIQHHNQFSREFRKLKNVRKGVVEDLILKGNYLHGFFYEGQLKESDFSSIEKKYLEIYSYLSKQKI